MSRLGKVINILAVSTVMLLIVSCAPAPAAAPAAQPGAATPQSEVAGARAPSGEPIMIGGAAPLTGPSAQQGDYIRRAVVQAVDEINEKGGVLGRPLQLVSFDDDKGDPKEAVSVASKLVNAGVLAVIGHWNSSASIPASVVYEEAQVIMISPGSTNPQLTEQGHKYTFRTAGRTDKGVGLLDAKYAYEKLGKRSAAILHDKSAFGQGLAEDFQRNFTSMGGQVVAFEAITAGERDFTPVLTKFRSLNPDMIFYGGYYSEAGLIARQRLTLGLDVTLMGAPELHSDQFLSIAGDAAEGTVTSAGPDTDLLPNVKQFMDRYRATYSDGPTEWALHAYDAVYILADAVERTGSTDRAAVRDAVAATKDFQGVFGSVGFDEKGDVLNDPNLVYTRKGGTWAVDALREGQWVVVRE